MAVFETIRNLLPRARPAATEIVFPAPPTTYSISPVLPRDISEIVKLNLRCFYDGDNYSKQTFNYLLNEPRGLSYKAITREGSIVAFLFVLVNSDGTAHVTTIGVDPRHRRRGLAKRLLVHLETVLLQKGISTIVLEVRVSNHTAQRLYNSLGYMVTQKVSKYYNNGEDGFLMVRSLA